MKHSIRARVTLLFAALTAALLLLIFCMNTWGLERFYRWQKIGNIEHAYAQINAEVMNCGVESRGLEDILQEYADTYNIAIALMDSADSRSIRSTERGGGYLFRRVQRYLFNKSVRDQASILKRTDNYTVISTKEEDGSANIDCFGYCGDNRTIVLMTTPLANLKESVLLANRFLWYVGSAGLILGLFLIFFMTRQVTLPIRRLASLSRKMGGLDFSERYSGSSQDEIGVLGSNMNAMADKLEETISELKEANERLREDIRKKIEIDEQRKEFIANVSHELKTPIALIQGYAEGLSDGLCSDPENRRYYLEVITDEAGKMNALVRQLLMLSGLESGAQEPERTCFNLTELVQGVLHSVQGMANKKQLRILLENGFGSEDAEIPAYADEFKMEEVVTNYVSNALNHAEPKSTVRVSMKPSGERVRVEVYNRGENIPEESLPHVWEKFYKVDKAHSRAYGGSGIGLSIVRAVMDAHGMPYGAENSADGVLFWFELPMENREEAEENRRPEAASPSRERAQI